MRIERYEVRNKDLKIKMIFWAPPKDVSRFPESRFLFDRPDLVTDLDFPSDTKIERLIGFSDFANAYYNMMSSSTTFASLQPITSPVSTIYTLDKNK